MDRRNFGQAAIAMAAGWPALRALAAAEPGASETPEPMGRALRALEESVNGRLGVAVLDTASGRLAGHRLDERFAMCSTFKVLLSALVLDRVDAGQTRLDRRITITPESLIGGSATTRGHVGEAMTVGDLCKAAITVSDNTGANLLLANYGGPAAVTAYVRKIGDDVTRLDRIEPSLNEATPGDPRDTSTPRAMAMTLQKLLLGNVLSAAGRAQLLEWMQATATGAQRLRAGFPADWRWAHKTGTGERGATCDDGIVWPPRRPPLIVVSYLTETTAAETAREGVLAGVARAIASDGARSVDAS